MYEKLNECENISDKAQTIVNIGLVYFDLGNDQESLNYLERGLELLQKHFSYDHTAISDCLTHLSFAHYHYGNYNAALECLFKSLEIDERLLPNDHPNLSAVENNIGKQFYKQGKYQDALIRFQRAADIDKKNSMDTTYPYSIVLNNLGKVHYRLQNFDRVTQYYDEALKLIVDSFSSVSSDHIYHAYTLKNKGEIQLAIGNLVGALELFEKVQKMYQRIFPDQPDHRDLGKCQLLFGQTYLAMGGKTKAQHAFDRTLQIWRKGLPETHPDFILLHQYMIDLEHHQTLTNEK